MKKIYTIMNVPMESHEDDTTLSLHKWSKLKFCSHFLNSRRCLKQLPKVSSFKKCHYLMRTMLFTLCLCLLTLSGCQLKDSEPPEPIVVVEVSLPILNSSRESEGKIGETTAVTRLQVAKMIALALYTKNELLLLEETEKFSDITKEDWSYPYVNGCATKGIFTDENEFSAEAPLLLHEAKTILELLAPTFSHGISLNEDNQDMAIAYSLWVDLFQEAVTSLGGQGIEAKQEIVLYTNDREIGLTHGIVDGSAYDMTAYTHTELHFLQKDNEILALLSVEDSTPTLESVYYRTVEEGLEVVSELTYIFPYDGAEMTGLGHITIGENEIDIESGTAYENDMIRRVSGNEISLQSAGILQLHDNFSAYDSDLFLKATPQFIIGSTTTDFYVLDGAVIGSVEHARPMPYNIRVLLGGGGQNEIVVSSQGKFTIENASLSKTFDNEDATLTANLPWFSEGVVTISSTDLFSLTFDSGETTTYEGSVELEVLDQKIVAVQTLPMEQYLLGVVPYEMPSSFGTTALEAQAICARSYAYNQFYASPYATQGANVIDTTANQVFKGAETTAEAKKAVTATEGLCLVMGDRVVQTYFYSTSSGLGARDVEVWSFDGNFDGVGKPYLLGNVHGIEEELPKTEADWLTFWQNWDISGYDEDSPWYRWKIYFEVEQLEEIVKNTLPTIAKNKVTVFDLDDTLLEDLPENLGDLQSVNLTSRGESGVVEKMEFHFTNIIVEVATEHALRSVLSPAKTTVGTPIVLQRKDGQHLSGQTMLPSGFFSIKELRNDDNELTGLSIYGGGYGHGVGLSQYGANALSQQGASAEEILQVYFQGVTVERVM
ncbi:MAG: SpoIID/LytB domain-containing protein [Bacillota bacterium]